jgi:hypothetical protein
MPKSRLTRPRDLKYRRVEVDGLRKGRRGKHHELMQDILSCRLVPLWKFRFRMGGIGLANLRSAVHRAANTRGLKIRTLADEKNFYVWKAEE